MLLADGVDSIVACTSVKFASVLNIRVTLGWS